MTENYIVTVGIQGPPGPTDFGKARISRIAGESLAAFVVVMIASDGKVYRASKSTPIHVSRVLGLTLAAAAINTSVDVHLFGEAINGAWNFDTTKLIYLGDDGALTQSAPTTGFVLVIGFPTAASSMFVVPGVSAILASAGAGDAGKAVALDSAGKLALSFLPDTLTGKDADTVDGHHAGNAAGNVLVLDGSALVPLAQVPATLTGKDADTVDGYHAGNTAGKLLVLDGSALVPLAQIPATLTGKNADTVDGYHASSLAKAGANSDITSLVGPITLVGGVLTLQGAAGANRYLVTDEINTGTGRLVMQAGGGSSGYGGAVNLYANAHATNPGSVVVGLSNNASAAFRVNTAGLDGGDDLLVVSGAGNVGIGTISFGAGAGVVAIANATSVPSSNPSGGVVFYADPADGKLKYRSASGEIRSLSYTV